MPAGRWKLITFIGKGNYQEALYRYNNKGLVKEKKTCFFPEAAAEWIVSERGANGEIVCLVTKEVVADKEQNNLNKFIEALKNNPQLKELKLKKEIFPWQKQDQLWDIFNILVNTINEKETVYFDITHSFRFVPAISLLSLIYLREVKNIDLKSVYYGNFEAKYTLDYAPVFDIVPFVELAEWLYGTRVFQEFGLSTTLSKKIKTVQREMRKEAQNSEGPRYLYRLGNAMDNLSKSLAVGNALAIGKCARQFISYFDENKEAIAAEIKAYVPPFVPLIEKVVQGYEVLAGEANQLDNAELEREENLIKWYAEKNDLSNTFQLLREFMVNAVLYAEKAPFPYWLETKFRDQNAERKLFNLKERKTPIGLKWEKVTQVRNLFSHGGFNKDNSFNPDKDYNELIFVKQPEYELDGFMEQIKKELPSTILTPLGLSKGLLFTLWQKYPDAEKTIILSSQEASKNIEEAQARTGYQGKVLTLLVDDPFTAFDEVEAKWQEIEEIIEGKIIVNITGGTTALQYIIEKLKNKIQKKGLSVAPIAAIDRRPPHEQRDSPWVEGEIIELEKDPEEE